MSYQDKQKEKINTILEKKVYLELKKRAERSGYDSELKFFLNKVLKKLWKIK